MKKILFVIFCFLLSCNTTKQELYSVSALMGDAGSCVSWLGTIGTPAGDVVISDSVFLDTDAEVNSLTIMPGGELIFDPGTSRTLVSHGNIEVRAGKLQMRPDNSFIVHRVSFPSVVENNFVGGGTSVLSTDVGLWVTEGGVLDLQGTDKTSWQNGSVVNSTWNDNDEIIIAPIGSAAPGPEGQNWSAIRATPSTAAGIPLTDEDYGFETEVGNLTRNVIIGGSPQGFSHVIFLGGTSGFCARQTIRNVRFEYVSPEDILGRYGLHFHHCKDSSRGTIISGVVVDHVGDRAFVPHASHGITIEESIASDVDSDGGGAGVLWWDPDTIQSYPSNASHDTTYRRIFIVDFGTKGFNLGQGTGNRIIDSVAAGSSATGAANAFEWPSQSNGQPNVWEFIRNRAHNIRMRCIRSWQNDVNDHLVSRFVGVRCGQGGFLAGAYGNSYHYSDMIIQVDGGGAAISIHATSRYVAHADPIIIERMHVLRANVGIESASHNADLKDQRQLVRDIKLENITDRAIRYNENLNAHPSQIDFIRITLDGNDITENDFEFDTAHPGTSLRYEERDGTVHLWNPSAGWSAGIPFEVSDDWQETQLN